MGVWGGGTEAESAPPSLPLSSEGARRSLCALEPAFLQEAQCSEGSRLLHSLGVGSLLGALSWLPEAGPGEAGENRP